MRMVERRAFRRCLKFDELIRAGHDYIHVYVGARVLVIGKIEQRNPPNDSYTSGGDRIHEGRLRDDFNPHERAERNRESHVGTRDSCCARSSIGLKNIAIDDYATLTEHRQVDHGTKRPAY